MQQNLVSNSQQQLLCDKDVAKALNISVSTMRRWRMTGGGVPFLKIGGAVRYSPESLRDYLKSCEVR
jgi:hypothetical protein